MSGLPRKSMGNALRSAVREGPEDHEEISRKSGESVLFNRLRREMLAQLIKRPCAHLRKIARMTKISAPAASWHLKKLQEAGYVGVLESSGKTLFYPAGMLDEETLPPAAALGDDATFKIFTLIEDEPGSTRKHLEERGGGEGERKTDVRGNGNGKGKGGGSGPGIQTQLAALLKSGLVSTVRDGKYTRYFPTELMADAREKQAHLMKAYRRSLTALLTDDRLDPKGSESAIRIPQIHIRTPDGEFVLSLKCELF